MAQLSESVSSLAHRLQWVADGRQVFRSYLRQSVALLGDEQVTAWYCTSRAAYANLAMVTAHYVIDVEGHDQSDDGYLGVFLLRSIESIALYAGTVESIPGTSKESLAVVMNHKSQPSSMWWVTEDAEEKVDLQSFTSHLLAAASSVGKEGLR